MEWVETTGRTVEEAKDRALDQLGVDEQDAEFEILEEPRGGLFGRLRSEARVRARVRPTRPRAKERERRGRGRKTTGDAGTAPAPAGAASGRRQPRRQPERSRPAAATDQEDRPVTVFEDVPLPDQAAVAREFLTGLLDRLGQPGDVSINEIDEDTVELAVVGDDLGMLIGPKGQTLASVQELTRTVVQRRTGGRNGRILVDVAGYRQKRRQALAAFTRQVADQVLASGVQTALEPMSAADRKVIHDTVNDIEGVATTSEGEEPRRRVVILPAR